MDVISYECARKVNDKLAWYALATCHRKLKVWRYPTSGSGGHYCSPYIDDLGWDDNPDDRDDDTIIAPDWDDLRAILNYFKPSTFTLTEFEGIDDIDQFAYELVIYVDEVKNKGI